ncbi:M48 family metallopeptidase [Pseudomonas sp. B35(2017)]|uniref:tetratricopeptide repeat protein n=1 Tax=Pseudomonas sp. B35(2017) TaxID=1981722 RepID=UPI000A1E4904|nr:hypothetical protein [Pseudomonas sp. B35(2017)]
MKVATKFVLISWALFFSMSSSSQERLSLYVSSSGSAAITEVHGRTSLVVMASGGEGKQSPSANCALSANLEAVEGGFKGELSPFSTEFNSYSDEQARGRLLQVNTVAGGIVIADVDYVGICSLDSNLVDGYKEIPQTGKKYKHVFSVMAALAHSDAVSLFKKGEKQQAIFELAPYAENYQRSWLAGNGESSEIVLLINDYAYFLQQNNQPLDSIPFLNDIVGADPKRAVAWLNLADSNWMIGRQSDAQKQYSEYKRLMVSMNKKSKIPQRVFDRAN